MNIHEYQAKQVLKKYGVPIPDGVVALKSEEIDNLIENFEADTYVVKAQIHAGGRGKAGGVKITPDKNEAKTIAQQLYGKTLVTPQTGPKGQVVKRVFIESGCNILHEYYLGAVVDRTSHKVTFMVSTEGGVNIEEVAAKSPEKIIKISIDPATGLQPFHCRNLAFRLGFLETKAKQLGRIIESVYNAFMATDASQVEINPLVETTDGNLLALDAKINFDENALFRHPEIALLRDEGEEDPLEVRANKSSLNYVRMEGNIGCMVNGAGLAMATMDIIKLYGAEPANFLDVGGGADKERVMEGFRIILSDKAIKGILVNIFGGIMRCDIIAEGIVAAVREVGIKVPLVIRLAGTNVELGKEILANSGLEIITADDLGDAAQKIVKAI
jgi:succinyl-CoA synthetase beta subunit